MTEPRAQRTLVKSPPELWAEISDPDALTRRLGELGEIRITRLAAESTVAWEGDRIRGTVELEASGWGTKVTLTAQSTEPDPAPIAEEEAAPVAAPARDAAPLAPAEPAPPAAPTPARRRPGLLALFRRRPRGSTLPAPAAAPPLPAAPAPAPAPPAPDPAARENAATPSTPDVEAILEAALDDLGFAQKRPFSR